VLADLPHCQQTRFAEHALNLLVRLLADGQRRTTHRWGDGDAEFRITLLEGDKYAMSSVTFQSTHRSTPSLLDEGEDEAVQKGSRHFR
jgi:hypothetical protein